MTTNDSDHDFSEDAVKTMSSVFAKNTDQLQQVDEGTPEENRAALGLFQDIARVCNAYDVQEPQARLELACTGLRWNLEQEVESAVAIFRENMSAQMALFGGGGGD